MNPDFMKSAYSSKRGVTLVELAVVILIVSLITGSIVIGQNMLRSAKLRSVMVDKEKYITAIDTFKVKYRALPGDMDDATEIWGAADSDYDDCADLTTASLNKATCNGDGDGHIYADPAGLAHERFRFWQHLSNAELITGSYAGVNNCTTDGDASCYQPEYNAPVSELVGATWAVYDAGQEASLPTYLYESENTIYRHVMYFGGERTTTSFPFQPVLTPKEAYQIDQKFDDGMPGKGFLMVHKPVSSGSDGNDNDCADDTDPDDAEYKLINAGDPVDSYQCMFVFLLDF